MFDKLENLLNQWVGEERKTLILEACEVLHAIGSDAAWSEISSYLEAGMNEPVAMVLDTIEGLLSIGLNSVIQAHAVTFEGPLALKVTLVKGLQRIQNWDDPDMVLALIENSKDTIEVFCNLMEMVTDKPWVEFVDGVSSVSNALLDKIASLYTYSEEDVNGVPFLSHDEERLGKLRSFLGAHPNLLANQALQNEGRPVGIPMSYLLNDYKLPLGLLCPKAPDQAALELVGLCLLSDIPLNDFARQAKLQTDQIYPDIDFITKVDLAMDKYLMEIIRHG